MRHYSNNASYYLLNKNNFFELHIAEHRRIPEAV